MKKRTLSIVVFSAIFAFATLTSCDGDSPPEEVTQKESTEAVIEETADEDNATEEEVVEEQLSKSAQTGADLFTANDCVTCHQVDKKIVGPALKDIAAGYTDNTEELVAFLAGEREAIIDPAQATVMAPQIETTKAMSSEERTAIADYIMSTK